MGAEVKLKAEAMAAKFKAAQDASGTKRPNESEL